jgi:hypothetical protein
MPNPTGHGLKPIRKGERQGGRQSGSREENEGQGEAN